MVTIEMIIQELREHKIPEEKLLEVERAYLIAKDIHQNQFRQRGEPYIIHPLHVAKNLLEMEVFDADAVSAALLHDTVEDAQIEFTINDIARLINPTVAKLVDGVTKLRRMNMTKSENSLEDLWKFLNGISKDVRVNMIKLADRTHNMETLEFKKPEKQIENAQETMDYYVPSALMIGAYQVKNKLEDLSLSYLHPDDFKRITERKLELQEKEYAALQEMQERIRSGLLRKGIDSEMIIRSQTINSIYKKEQQGFQIDNIYDLFYLKILVPDIEDCYPTQDTVHANYRPINGRQKDYLYSPKPNYYQSLHTTVAAYGKIRKVKIRTHTMDKVAAFGVSALWNIPGGKTKEETQEELREKCRILKTTMEMRGQQYDAETFANIINQELFPSEHVYVVSYSGLNIELPAKSTALDYVCQYYPDLLDRLTGILINGREAPPDQELKNGDIVSIITGDQINKKHWENYVTVPTSIQKIKQLNGQS